MASTRWGAVAAISCCAVLLAAYALTAWTAVLKKSAAVDEPTHAVAGWMQLARGDFRVNPQEPPLWKFAAARPIAGVELPVDQHARSRLLDDASASDEWSRAVLYGTQGRAVTADALLMRSRAVLLGVAVVLGAMTGWWAWRIAGPLAAVVAVALFALDPNFIAHGPLLQGDVAMSLALLATLYAAWRCGRRASPLRIGILAILAGITFALRFSGIIGLLVVCCLVASRAFVPAGWPLLRDRMRKWWGRYVTAAVVVATVVAVAITALWASYGFRFAPAPEPGAAMNMQGIVAEVGAVEARLQSRGNKRLATQPVAEPPLFVRIALSADAKRLMPQAWIYGAIDAYQAVRTRAAYMLGQTRRGGWWSFYPFAMAVKTPLATLAAAVLALWALGAAWRRHGPPGEAAAWTITCLALPVVLYVFFANLARFDFSLRHVLPIYPLLYIAIGVAVALAWQRRGPGKWVVATALVAGLATETVRAYPNYVPFFNAAARAVPRGPVYLLGESNLDLGQDLPLLVDWQAAHPDRKLYLSYYGAADPALYGVEAIDVRGEGIDRRAKWPAEPGAVLAVSTTYLQGFVIEPEVRSAYTELRAREPLAILGGGSIYLYELAPAK